MFLPSLWDHHHDGFLESSAIHQQEFQNVVEGSRVGAHGLDDGEEFLEFLAEQFALGHTFASPHPVDVSSEGVDFPVVAHETQRLGPIPTRECIGRKPRVDHG